MRRDLDLLLILFTCSEQHSPREAREGQTGGSNAHTDGTEWTNSWQGKPCS